MNSKEALDLRELVYKEYKNRVQLGEFDANSHAIQLLLHTTVDILNHILEQTRKEEKSAKK